MSKSQPESSDFLFSLWSPGGPTYDTTVQGQPSLSLDDHSYALLTTPRDQEHCPRPGGISPLSFLPFFSYQPEILPTRVLTQSTVDGVKHSRKPQGYSKVTRRKRDSMGPVEKLVGVSPCDQEGFVGGGLN